MGFEDSPRPTKEQDQPGAADDNNANAAPRACDEITLVGQPRSGKTNLLATLLNNPKVTDDLLMSGQDATDLTLRADPRPDTDDQEVIERLRKHYSEMLKGQDMNNESTRHSYSVPCVFTTMSERRVCRLRKRTIRERTEHEFIVNDGRGESLARDEGASLPEREYPDWHRREAYRSAIDRSVGQIICIPSDPDEFSAGQANYLLEELSLALSRKRENPELPRLKHVALCFTKYESLFCDHGADAWRFATDRGFFLKKLREHAYGQVFRNLIADGRDGGLFTLRLFPVSSYGFIPKSGASNYYDHSLAPGLLTRTVDPERDYADIRLNNNQERDQPDRLPFARYEDHFPFARSHSEATNAWRPFNVMPPIIFALTGEDKAPRAGEDNQPVSISADEFVEGLASR